jgi:hypothetical protein
VVPLTVPAVVPLVDVPGALPGAGAELLALLSVEAALPEAVVLGDGEPLISLAELDVVLVPVEAVVVGDVLVSVPVDALPLGVVVVVVVVLGVDAAVVLGVVVVLLVVVLLRSQPAAAVARTMAAAMGMKRFMTSPIQCAW